MAGKFKVKVGGAGIEVGAIGFSSEGSFQLPPVIKKRSSATKISKLPVLKTKPFRFTGRKRRAIKVIMPNKPAHAKCTRKTSTPFGQMPATPLPKPKPLALSGRKSS